LGEPGVSYFIQDEGQKILFDVGYSDIFIKNAQKMNIHFWDLDYLVLSHGHLDHTWGLTSLIKYYTEASIEKIDYNKPTVVTHPSSFLAKRIKGLEQNRFYNFPGRVKQTFQNEIKQRTAMAN